MLAFSSGCDKDKDDEWHERLTILTLRAERALNELSSFEEKDGALEDTASRFFKGGLKTIYGMVGQMSYEDLVEVLGIIEGSGGHGRKALEMAEQCLPFVSPAYATAQLRVQATKAGLTAVKTAWSKVFAQSFMDDKSSINVESFRVIVMNEKRNRDKQAADAEAVESERKKAAAARADAIAAVQQRSWVARAVGVMGMMPNMDEES